MDSTERSRSPGTEDLITEGQFVLVQRGEQDKIIEFKAEGKLKFGRAKDQQEIELRNALGYPFYTTFRVQRSSIDGDGEDKANNKRCYLEPIAELTMQDGVSTFNSERGGGSSGKDNRNIVDDNKSQPLRQTDIAVLREKGVSGPEILDALITKSKTFTQKTEFSQEKYLKKKVRAYGDSLLFVKPTLKNVGDYYFKKDPSKLMNLRGDSLAQLLTYSNVTSGGRYMVYETGCSSLVVAAVLQRLGGTGLCLHIHTGSTPQRQALYYMNFGTQQLKPLQTLDIFYIIRHSRPAVVPESCEDVTQPSPRKKPKIISEDELMEEGDDEPPAEDTKTLDSVKSVTRLENEASAALFNGTEFDGLIICAKEHPLTILQNLLQRLRGSAPFVIFCQFPEPLGDCFTWLKDGNHAVNLNVFDNWYRYIQVQPERTHPEINMSPNGGYILSGIFVTK